MNLPAPCEKCAPFFGAWMEIENGLRRCDCERGKAMRTPQKPAAKPAILSEASCSMFAEMLASLRFYPSEAAARGLIGEEIGSMCNSEAEAGKLVREMVRRYKEWPGLLEMRAVFCAIGDPRDGVMAISPTVEEVREREIAASAPQIACAPQRQLAAGEPVSASPSIAATLSDLVRAKDMNRVVRGALPAAVRDIPVVRLTDANRITEADIKRAEEALRTQKAKEAAGL